MFRKRIVLMLVCLMALALASSATTAEGNNRVECDPAHATYCEVSPGEQLVITNHWGACRRGLVQAFLRAIEVQEYALDGQLLWDTQEASQYWGPTEQFWDDALQYCTGQVSTGYISYWEHELDLGPGDYELHFTLSLEHPLIDGIDRDEDGRPDQYSGQLKNRTVDIHVVGPSP